MGTSYTYLMIRFQNRVPAQIDAILENVTTEQFPLYKPFLGRLTNLTTIEDSKK